MARKQATDAHQSAGGYGKQAKHTQAAATGEIYDMQSALSEGKKVQKDADQADHMNCSMALSNLSKNR